MPKTLVFSSGIVLFLSVGGYIAWRVLVVEPPTPTPRGTLTTIPNTGPIEPAEEPERREPIIDATEYSDTRNESEPLITGVDDYVTRRLSPWLQQNYFADGPPNFYIRHRIVKIHATKLRNHLHAVWSQSADTGGSSVVEIEFFDGQTLGIETRSWLEGNFGVEMASGVVADPGFDGSEFWLSFAEDGRIDGSITTAGTSYLLKTTPETPYYLVLALDADAFRQDQESLTSSDAL